MNEKLEAIFEEAYKKDYPKAPPDSLLKTVLHIYYMKGAGAVLDQSVEDLKKENEKLTQFMSKTR